MRTYWRHGDRAELARRSEISISYLADLLAGRRTPSPALAERIEGHALDMGIELHRLDLLYPKSSTCPLMNLKAIRLGLDKGQKDGGSDQ